MRHEFYERLRKLAEDRGVSQAEVARRCDIEPRTYANYVSGKRQPDFDTLIRICDRMGVTPNDLLIEDSYFSVREKMMARLKAALATFSTEEISLATMVLETIAAHRKKSSDSK